jgi:hypothetical protein
VLEEPAERADQPQGAPDVRLAEARALRRMVAASASLAARLDRRKGQGSARPAAPSRSPRGRPTTGSLSASPARPRANSSRPPPTAWKRRHPRRAPGAPAPAPVLRDHEEAREARKGRPPTDAPPEADSPWSAVPPPARRPRYASIPPLKYYSEA